MLAVKVWGDYACFTRPEMKAERVSYPVITPSAARGILEAIFWKPECSWQVGEIHVLRPIRYASIMRNEVNSRQSENVARAWARDGRRYDVTEDRTQRHTLALRDVAYVIKADVLVRDQPRSDAAKFRDQFRRRVERGRCFATPYLGTREFSAFFSAADGSEQPIAHTEDLGRMLFDLAYAPGNSGAAQPLFFDARLDGGVLRVPRAMYERRN